MSAPGSIGRSLAAGALALAALPVSVGATPGPGDGGEVVVPAAIAAVVTGGEGGRAGGAVVPAGGAVVPAGGAVVPAGGAVVPAGGAVVPAGGAPLACGVHRACCFLDEPRVDPLAAADLARSALALGPALTTSGPLAPRQVRRALGPHLGALAACARADGRPLAAAARTLTLRIGILPGGRASLLAAAAVGPAMTQCLAGAVGAIAFPRGPAGAVTQAIVPLVPAR